MNIRLEDLKKELNNLKDNISLNQLDKDLKQDYKKLKILVEKEQIENPCPSIFIVDLKKLSSYNLSELFLASRTKDLQRHFFIFINLKSFSEEIKNKYDYLNYACFLDPISERDTIVLLRDLIAKKMDYYNKCQILMDLLLEDYSLDEILEEASLVFNNPIVVIDKSFKIVANSKVDNIKDKYWLNNIANGFCSYDFVNSVNNIREFREGISKNVPFYMTCQMDKSEKLISKIFTNKKEFGYLIVLDSMSKVNLDNLDLTSFLAKIVSEYLLKNTSKHFYLDLTRENLLTSLLDGSIVTSLDLKERLKLVEEDFPKTFKILLLDLRYGENKSIDGFIEEINKVFVRPLILYFDRYLVCVFDSRDLESKKDKLKMILKKTNLTGLISSELDNLLSISSAYKILVNNLDLIDLLNLKDNLIEAQSLRMISVFKDLSKKNNLIDYCNPKLLNLVSYDLENKTDYYSTLKTYCETNMNLVESAKELYLHRNTIAYRLAKIEELFDIKIEGYKDYLDLLLSISILEYLNLIKQTN